MWDIRNLDHAYPTVVRYTGLVLTVVLTGFSLGGYYAQAAPGFVAAAGMILFKTVRDAATPEENKKPADGNGA